MKIKNKMKGPSSDYYENIISDLRNEINELNEVTDSSLNNRIAELEALLVVEEEERLHYYHLSEAYKFRLDYLTQICKLNNDR